MSGAPICVRAATEQDLDAVVELEKGTAQAPHWPRRTYEEILTIPQTSDGPCRCLVVAVQHEVDLEQPTQPGSLLGFAVAAVLLENGMARGLPAELESMAVRGSAQRQGVGRALGHAVMSFALSHGAPSMELEVRAGNHAAVSLYRALGFKEIGRRAGYYSDPEEDAILMRAALE